MRFHFIAIGGAAMHGLALALHHQGHQVTGSDDVIADPSRRRLADAGLLPDPLGWHPERIGTHLDAVILGMHARRDNPELERALALSLQVWSFPEYLYLESRAKRRAVVGGSHGKTTVTALVMHALRAAGRRFDYMVGAELAGFERMVGLDPGSPIAVFEGDEYPASALDMRPKFHLYRPHLALINGIAWDHANVFPTPEVYELQFRSFVELTEPDGIVLYNEEDPAVCRVVEHAPCGVRRTPFRTPPYRVVEGRFQVRLGGAETPVPLLGRHNMRNLAAAAALCRELEIEESTFAAAAASFTGASRRLQPLANDGNRRVFLDFAHAPSKVHATVEGLREAFPERELVAVLELHTFSSVRREFIGNYRGTLDRAERAAVFVAPETCRQKGVAPLRSEEVRAAFGRQDLVFLADRESLESFLRGLRETAETVLLMSSGSFAGADVRALLGLEGRGPGAIPEPTGCQTGLR